MGLRSVTTGKQDKIKYSNRQHDSYHYYNLLWSNLS
jgi:hypothetical protein